MGAGPNPEIHHRYALRLKGYDYSRNGAYFITVCSYKKECIFEDDKIRQTLADEWDSKPVLFQNVELDEFIVMPNHVHAIVWIKPVGAGLALPNKELPSNKSTTDRCGPRPAASLGDIVCAFKSKTAVYINRYRNTSGVPVWQRNYYDHIIRDEKSLRRIQEYIVNNPLKWGEDIENPLNGNKSIKNYYDRIF
jgi:putative transposase